ncbi:MAG: hypothetical protein KC657_31875 [Myxococcales bacterium]|nr:hypothetical protein [Myxococcales bacterium]
MPQILPPKKDVALALLERSSVFVHLDPRAGGVMVPVHFRKQPRLVLQIGLNMPIPIPDLVLDEDALSCTLSFSRSPFHCVVPWGSIFAMVGEDGRGMVWPDDVPEEIAKQAASEQQREAPPAPESSASVGKAGGSKPKTKRAAAKKVAGEPAPSKGRRPRKKKEERPVLVAVEGSGGGGGPSADRPARPGAKPKRELPPYLRVVK